MNININSLYGLQIILNESTISRLSYKHAKILSIALIAFGGIAVSYALYCTFRSKNIKNVIKDKNNLNNDKIIQIAEKEFDQHPLKDKILKQIRHFLQNQENQDNIYEVWITGYENNAFGWEEDTIGTIGDTAPILSDFFKRLNVRVHVEYLKYMTMI